MARYNIAIGGDYQRPDGSPFHRDVDFTPFDEVPGLRRSFLPRDPTILAGDLAGMDALLLLGQRMERQSFPSDGRLALIARLGVGYDKVDVDACNEAAVALLITPQSIRRPVASSVIAFMLALTLRMFDKDRITRLGPAGWSQRSSFNGMGLAGRTLGLLGVGNIGSEIVRLAAPFDMEFIAHDPFIAPEQAAALGVRLVTLEELAANADVLSINCPLTPGTLRIVDEAFLRRMKRTAYLINTARGPICDQVALARALDENWIAGAGLDVFDPEPPAADDPLLRASNVILAPHALSFTDQFFSSAGRTNVGAVKDILEGRVPTGGQIVNRAILEDPRWQSKLSEMKSRSR